MADNDARAYRLQPLDTSGIFLGLGAIQCLLVGTGIAAAVGSLTLGLPLPAAAIPLLAVGAITFARIGGQPAWEWLPLGAGWMWNGRRSRRWFAPLPLWPHTCDTPLPPCLDGIDIVEIDRKPSLPLGAVRDRPARTLTAIVPVRGPQFLAKPRVEQEQLLASWGDLLGQFAVDRGVVTHISWSDLARPSGIHEHLAWAQDRLDNGHVPDAAASYRELLDTAHAAAMSHEVVLTITVAHDRLGRHKGSGATEALSRALAGSTDALLRGLRSANLEALPPLDAAGIGRLLQDRLNPSTARSASSGRLALRLNLSTTSTGPMALEEGWHEIHVDDTWHRTWWIGTWPRSPMPPAWMEPFLSTGGITRAVTVVLMPVSGRQSRRRIERDLVKLESDAAAKEDKGRRVDARHRRATKALLDREEEIVAGYPEVGYAGFVTVAARTLDELDEHSEIVEQLARESGMELRLLAARQAAGWVAALPMGLAPSAVLAT